MVLITAQVCNLGSTAVQSSVNVGRDGSTATADHHEEVSDQSHCIVWSCDSHVMYRFSRDDLLQMDFDAYVASSSGESGSECGTPGEVGGRPTVNHSTTNKATKYRSLLAAGEDGRGEGGGDGEEGRGKGGGDGEEVMEISWKPGLKEGVEGIVRKRQEEEGEGATTWDHYIREKNKKKKEKRAKVKVRLLVI